MPNSKPSDHIMPLFVISNSCLPETTKSTSTILMLYISPRAGKHHAILFSGWIRQRHLSKLSDHQIAHQNCIVGWFHHAPEFTRNSRPEIIMKISSAHYKKSRTAIMKISTVQNKISTFNHQNLKISS